MLNWFATCIHKSSHSLYTQAFSQSVYAILLAICIRKPSRNLYTQVFSQSVYTSSLAICIRKPSRSLYTQAFSQSVYASLLKYVYASLLAICIHKSCPNLYVYASHWMLASRQRVRQRQTDRERGSSTRQTWHAECFNLLWARWTGQTRRWVLWATARLLHHGGSYGVDGFSILAASNTDMRWQKWNSLIAIVITANTSLPHKRQLLSIDSNSPARTSDPGCKVGTLGG